MATPIQLESLRKAIACDRLPFCSGAVLPPPEGLHLHYGKEDSRFLNLESATLEDLDSLIAACDPATFGRGDEDVYDESYRKAVKMDASNFAVQFDPAASGLLKTIENQLLQGDTEKMRIKAELYKLNIYDKGSFFKAHRDTPRGTNVLGSLVIIYPTPHKGGELVLRHKDREWKFDAKTLTVFQNSPSLAYVAFYSDIEHEVLKVTSGRRVTITYNMYLVDPEAVTGSSPITQAITQYAQNISDFRKTLQSLLKRPEFLPAGGTLGFGLVHLYPVTFETELRDLANYLKGEDALVYQACRELRISPSLQVIYEDDRRDDERYGVMIDRIVKDPHYDCESGESYEGTLVGMGGIAVNKTESTADLHVIEEFDGRGEAIAWVSPFNQRIQLQDVQMRYGNEVTTGYTYCSPCIIAYVPPAFERL